MPQLENVRADAYLTGVVRDAQWNDEGYIHDEICTVVPAKSSSVKYKIRGSESTYNDVATTKSRRARPNFVDFDFTNGSAAIETYEQMGWVDDDDVRDAVDEIDPFNECVLDLRSRVNLMIEIDLVTLMAATSYGSTPSNDWDHADGTPLTDLMTGKNAGPTQCGKDFTHFIIGDHVANELAVAKGVLDNVKYQSFWDVLSATGEKFASQDRLGLTPVLAKAKKEGAIRGATASIARVIGDDAYLIRKTAGKRGNPYCLKAVLSDFYVVKARDDMAGGWDVKVGTKIKLIEFSATSIYKFTDVT